MSPVNDGWTIVQTLRIFLALLFDFLHFISTCRVHLVCVADSLDAELEGETRGRGMKREIFEKEEGSMQEETLSLFSLKIN